MPVLNSHDRVGRTIGCFIAAIHLVGALVGTWCVIFQHPHAVWRLGFVLLFLVTAFSYGITAWEIHTGKRSYHFRPTVRTPRNG